MAQMQTPKSNFDAYGHLNIALNDDGTLNRLIILPTSPVTGENPEDGELVASKEIVLDAQKNTSIRIYRPIKIPTSNSKLPIIFYFHAGGFILFTIQDKMIHEYCNQISQQLPAIIISVGYRLAPENRIPAQYDDAIDSIQWLHNQSIDLQNSDPWLTDYADFSRCYLFGTSSGGNIAYNTALRLLDMQLEPISISGMILNQPLFSGNKRTNSELKLATDPLLPLPAIDLLWELALPIGLDRDHRYCNPFNCGPLKDKIKRLGRTLVIGFGGDVLIDRYQAFVDMLGLQGIEVEGQFADAGFHGIDMIDAEQAADILLLIKDFVTK